MLAISQFLLVSYIEEAERIRKECPGNLQEYLGRQFVAGLSDKSNFDKLHVLLDDDENFTFLEAKTAVIRAQRRIGQPSSFGSSTLAAKRTPPAPEVTKAQVNAIMLSLMEAMEIRTKAQDTHQRMSQYQQHASTPLQLPPSVSRTSNLLFPISRVSYRPPAASLSPRVFKRLTDMTCNSFLFSLRVWRPAPLPFRLYAYLSELI